MIRSAFAPIPYFAGLSILMQLCSPVHAAVIPDRTRIIYNAESQSESLTVANKSEKYPYVVQSWI